jgi:protein TonB
MRHLAAVFLSALALLLAGCAADGTAPGGTQEWKPATPNQAPPYPPESRLNGEQGQVLLHVRTDAAGRPTEVKVMQSSGFVRLDDAAVKAVRQWQFKPLAQDDVVTWREVPITFRLGGLGAPMPR